MRPSLLLLTTIVFLPLASPAVALEQQKGTETAPRPFVRYYTPTYVKGATVTAYTASPDETDGSPSITSDGTKLPSKYGLIACPQVVPFGTLIQYGSDYYWCHDVMNKRYRDGNNWDILLPTKKEAFAFGRRKNQTLTIWELQK